ncbi:hypothetical protein [Geomicrobium sp. JCM 19039]|uniref:hypothetical protein n=1 Tax=Geomicrobium sp. JCM 19039 TaxID=1460636 RepID=UPI00045F1A0C|nr:hypothetical protein [Geomicrobium sp. JCM 19039]GAK13304.1 hypothetical protein JCM19039_3142 [Geomicrobium sp. JCM 19039]
MSKNQQNKKGQSSRDAELIQISEDLIYFGSILNTTSSFLGLIGVQIAREVAARTENTEATEAATGFAFQSQVAENSLLLRDGQIAPEHLENKLEQLRTELNHVNWKIKNLQSQLNRKR